MHPPIDTTCMPEDPPIARRLGALLRERQMEVAAGPADGTAVALAGSAGSYLAAAGLAAGLIAIWMGLCVI